MTFSTLGTPCITHIKAGELAPSGPDQADLGLFCAI